jgi:hypothetical protein
MCVGLRQEGGGCPPGTGRRGRCFAQGSRLSPPAGTARTSCPRAAPATTTNAADAGQTLIDAAGIEALRSHGIHGVAALWNFIASAEPPAPPQQRQAAAAATASADLCGINGVHAIVIPAAPSAGTRHLLQPAALPEHSARSPPPLCWAPAPTQHRTTCSSFADEAAGCYGLWCWGRAGGGRGPTRGGITIMHAMHRRAHHWQHAAGICIQGARHGSLQATLIIPTIIRCGVNGLPGAHRASKSWYTRGASTAAERLPKGFLKGKNPHLEPGGGILGLLLRLLLRLLVQAAATPVCHACSRAGPGTLQCPCSINLATLPDTLTPVGILPRPQTPVMPCAAGAVADHSLSGMLKPACHGTARHATPAIQKKGHRASLR